ncbi:hypothetical protein TRIATDRAFT_154787 [Trichoderma atroviride IMI 206040]|uniref:Cyclohexanone monooxygenase n=1 Tax=Hypocrea atroviridis (strain ATCC 20476 / IMI 206040) TaxID=452589 RepID=G9NQR5_HYPAI|nr:uncharacterized protein TRIATDRAFT_154787 [Trichoderma atroviride IMI 206040]EHK46886.1 hypothetical protein TRIATDRAFT_154787 [Trichoderma atroviride IMI 206040]
MSSVDAVVIGAGFGGLYNLIKLRELGLSVRAFDKAPEIGGTWYWSQYPGATSDSASEIYRFRFNKDLLQTDVWPDHYVSQQGTLQYLKNIAKLYDLEKDIQLKTKLVSAAFDSASSTWTTTFDNGEVWKSTYLIMAVGIFHTPNYPKITGLENFKGPVYHTGEWTEQYDLKDKRVGIIGNGSSGAQMLVNIADDVKQAISFQRSAQYVAPHPNKAVTAEYREKINKTYDDVWKLVDNHPTGMPLEHQATSALSVSPEERERIWEEVWDKKSGFSFMYGVFGDIHSSEEANKELCKFFNKKIAQIVEDPEKVKKLTPNELYGKRPVTLSNYYETFNKKNVDIVNYQHTPFVEITENGIRTTEKLHELDVIILATGFEVVDGSYATIDIKGRNETLNQQWARDGVSSYLAIGDTGFPNLFFSVGPQSPLGNMPPIIETQGTFVHGLIAKAEKLKKENGGKPVLIEADAEAKKGWMDLCRQIANGSIFRNVKSYIFGNNGPRGDDNPGIFWLAGYANYRKAVEDATAKDYAGFKFSS